MGSRFENKIIAMMFTKVKNNEICEISQFLDHRHYLQALKLI